MPTALPQYSKLPGRGTGLGEVSRLYLADDHLLLTTATGFSENYRRFYLRDIQAISARKTVTGAIVNALLGTIILPLAIGMTSSGDAAEWIGWGIPTGFFLTLLLVNVFRGPTCACDIHTAVQTRRLGSVNRLRAVRKLIARLRPAIDATQGTLPVEELRQRIDRSRHHPFTADAPPVIRPVGW